MDCDNNPVVVEVETDVHKEHTPADAHAEDEVGEPSTPSLPQAPLPGR